MLAGKLEFCSIIEHNVLLQTFFAEHFTLQVYSSLSGGSLNVYQLFYSLTKVLGLLNSILLSFSFKTSCISYYGASFPFFSLFSRAPVLKGVCGDTYTGINTDLSWISVFNSLRSCFFKVFHKLQQQILEPSISNSRANDCRDRWSRHFCIFWNFESYMKRTPGRDTVYPIDSISVQDRQSWIKSRCTNRSTLEY